MRSGTLRTPLHFSARLSASRGRLSRRLFGDRPPLGLSPQDLAASKKDVLPCMTGNAPLLGNTQGGESVLIRPFLLLISGRAVNVGPHRRALAAAPGELGCEKAVSRLKPG